jgi:hypothetical protein
MLEIVMQERRIWQQTRLQEMLAHRVQVEGDFESLYCEDLPPVPSEIKNLFSAVLGATAVRYSVYNIQLLC